VKAFVTGGAGFIGSTLVDRLLAEGHRVDVVDDLSRGSLANLADARRDPDHDLHFQRMDVASDAVADVLARRRPDVVYHLAAGPGGAGAGDDPVADATTSVLGALRVLEAARRSGVRKIVFALPATTLYADEPSSLPSRESAPVRPVDVHAVAKHAVTRYLAVYRELHDLEYTALAVSTVYGPRQASVGDPESVVGLVRAHLAGEAVTVPGDGSQTRDLVYVDDVVDALARAADRGSGLLVNIGTGVETAVADLVALVARATGSAVPVHRGDRAAGVPPPPSGDAGRARIHLGWEPWTDVASGVAAVVDWARTAPAR
jgi:UDP-glucose 4-epimerase